VIVPEIAKGFVNLQMNEKGSESDREIFGEGRGRCSVVVALRQEVLHEDGLFISAKYHFDQSSGRTHVFDEVPVVRHKVSGHDGYAESSRLVYDLQLDKSHPYLATAPYPEIFHVGGSASQLGVLRRQPLTPNLPPSTGRL